MIDKTIIARVKTSIKKNKSVTKNMVCNQTKFIWALVLIVVFNRTKNIQLHVCRMCNHNNYIRLHKWSKEWNHSEYNPNIKKCTDVRLKLSNKNKQHSNKYYHKGNITVTQKVLILHAQNNSRNSRHASIGNILCD